MFYSMGLINQDKKNGWRGPITNIKKTIEPEKFSQKILIILFLTNGIFLKLH